MATAAQIEANRANAQLSTGPRTPVGKAASAQNNLRHGLRSTAVLLPSEDAAEFAELHNSLRANFHPRDFSEERFVREMTDAEWRLQRVRRHIGQLFRCKYEEIAAANPSFTPDRVEFETMQALHAAGSPLQAFNRYEAKFERQYRLAYDGMRRYRADNRCTPTAQPAKVVAIQAQAEVTDEPNSRPPQRRLPTRPELREMSPALNWASTEPRP